MDRPYDITLLGASGFTGGLVAEYLARHAPASVRWAIAGRSRTKLERLAARLSQDTGDPRRPQIVVVDTSDLPALQHLAAQTRVLITTVGPFVDLGEPVLAACIAQGTDYLDSTGEPAFLRTMISRHAGPAADSGARFVLSCGFDSAIADLGTLYTLSQVRPTQPVQLTAYVRMQAALSAGTQRSAIKSLADPRSRALPADTQTDDGRHVYERKAPIRAEPSLGGISAPFPTIDASVVLRSASLLPVYGPDFGYTHCAMHASWLHVMAALLAFAPVSALARLGPIRDFMLKLAPPAGTGPDRRRLERNWFRVDFVARSGDQALLATRVTGPDPAYLTTALILSEAALCLTLQRDALPARSGILTPATALGEPLIARLTAAGIEFSVC